MSMISIGDMSQSLLLRSRATDLKQSMAVLLAELSSGRVSDPSSRLGGDYSHLIDIDRNLTRLQGYSIAVTEAKLFASATQSRLERLQDLTGSFSTNMLLATTTKDKMVQANVSQQARADLADAMGVLNGGIAGRSLFSGVSTDVVPLESDTLLMSELKIVLTGLSTASDIMQAAENWFEDPAGFRTTIYRGSSQDLSSMQVASGQHVGLSLRADEPEFRDMLLNMAIVAIATDADLNLVATTRDELFHLTSNRILANNDKLVLFRADLGYAESRIEEAATRNESARTSLEYAKAALLEADPFDTATRLESVQFQLEALYSVTVRASRLSLLAFLK
ncbi:MAG: flagellar biosynthesis protein FlgL [Rhodobacteraceae bacterium]|nr:flagellar biosynthesis protein FlgL [Paracoccaceae bacterium]